MYNLGKILDEAIHYAEISGCPISRGKISAIVNVGSAKKALGYCKYIPREDRYYISVSKYTLQCDYNTIRNTIAHEVVHCCVGCLNHGSVFQKWASVLEKAGNYSIGVKASREESKEFSSNIRHKYTVICNVCGNSVNHDRKCGVMTMPQRYRCGRCNSIGQFRTVMNY